MNKLRYMVGLSVAAFCACGAFAADAVRRPLFEDGRFELGVNYWASETATRMWRDWRPESIEKDLAALEAHGVTVLRVFPTWSDFQPIVEIHAAGNRFADQKETRFTLDELPLPDTPAGRAGVDEKMLGRFAEFCDMAERHGMKLIVPILTGHMTFRLFLPPALENRDPQADPIALEWEARFIECFVNALKGKNPGLIDGFTPDQRFYLSFGAIWAQNITDQEKERLTNMDPHSLARNRVNVSLRNFQSFFDAFDIKEGDPMFRPEEERVHIW